MAGGGTAGSRSLQMGGVAIDSACLEVIEKGRELAAETLEVDQTDLELGNGGFQVRGVPTRSVRWADLAARAGGPRGLFSAIDFTQSGLTYPFGAHVAVVEVDADTGDVRLVRHVAVDDAGPIVNPLLARGQQHGGIAQGAAQALFEEVLYDPEGTPRSSSLIDYTMPTANEPIVKAKRIFLRKRLANISPRNFMLHLWPQRPGAAPVQAFPFRGAELYPRAAPRLDR